MASVSAENNQEGTKRPKLTVVEVKSVELPSHSTRKTWIEDWETTFRSNIKLCRRDVDYYHHHQWTREDLDTLRRRKQPALVNNRIKKKVDFILGQEIRNRVDPKAIPRTISHDEEAEAATDALRFVEEEQSFDKVRSMVTKDALTAGYGGAIKEIEVEDEDPKHKLTYVFWDRLAWDPHSRLPDFSDAMWRAIFVWRDLGDAIRDFPDAEDILKNAMSQASANEITDDTPRNFWIDRARQRVKIVEMYVNIGNDCYRFDFTEAADLRPGEPTAYLDEDGKRSVCPLMMTSANVDNNGNRYGAIRGTWASSQEQVNKRESKMMHLLNTEQTLWEEGSIPSPETFRRERAKPDGMPMVRRGALKDGSVQPIRNLDLAQSQFLLLQEAKRNIDDTGPSATQIPDAPDTASGRSLIVRQQNAAMELGSFFDNMREWDLSVYKLDWLCIRQFWPFEKWVRVRDEKASTGYRYVGLNQQITRAQRFAEILQKGGPARQQVSAEDAARAAAGMFSDVVLGETLQRLEFMRAQAQQTGAQVSPEQLEQAKRSLIMQHPLMQEQISKNQVGKMLVDIIIEETPDTAVVEQEEFESLANVFPTVMNARSDMAPFLVKTLLSLSQLRNRKDIIEQMEQGPSQAEQQLQQMRQQMELMRAQLELKELQATVAEKQTQALLNQARARSELADADLEAQKAPSEIVQNRAVAMNQASMAQERAQDVTERQLQNQLQFGF